MPIDHQQSSGGRQAPACRAPLAFLALLLLPCTAAAQSSPPLAPPPLSPPPGTRTECNAAGLALSQIGATRLQQYRDGQGTTVELWCDRRVFASNYDLRVIRDGQSRTVAGCYFNEAENTGPLLHLAPSGAYSRIEWLNESRSKSGTSYRFAYDIAANEVTITATAPCRPPVTLTVPPQPDFRHLERLLPPDADCPAQ